MLTDLYMYMQIAVVYICWILKYGGNASFQIPGATMFLVGTHLDKLPPKGKTDLLQKKLQDITYNIKDAEGKAIENIRTEINALR